MTELYLILSAAAFSHIQIGSKGSKQVITVLLPHNERQSTHTPTHDIDSIHISIQLRSDTLYERRDEINVSVYDRRRE